MLSEQQQRIMGYFIEEAKDHLNTIEQGLLSLQQTIEDPDMVSELFRAAHSVKGGAAMLGVNSIQQTAHRLEDYFKVLKECPIRIDQKLESLLLAVFDALKELLDQLQGPFGLTDDKAQEVMTGVEPVFGQLNQHLGTLVSQSGSAPPEDVELGVSSIPVTAPPVSAPPRVKADSSEEGALQLLFQSDIPARLREMLQLFKQPDQPQVRQQLQSICQSFIRIGEQFELPAWIMLVLQAEQAIANPENGFRLLAPTIITEIKQARDLVLAGRTGEIQASAALQAMLPIEETIATDDFADLLSFEMESDSPLDLTDLSLSEALIGNLSAADLTAFDTTTFFDDSTFTQAEDDSEPLFDFEAFSAETSSDDDLGFSEALGLEALGNAPTPNQEGPEVGAAELNSLADLFEGEMPELGMNWEEEEVLSSGDLSAELNFSDTADLEGTGDFSDLLFGADSTASLNLSEALDDDLANLFNEADLFGEGEAITEDDLFGQGQSAAPDTLNVLSFDAPFDFDIAPSSTSSAPSDFESLGDLFSGLDESDLLSVDQPEGGQLEAPESLGSFFEREAIAPDGWANNLEDDLSIISRFSLEEEPLVASESEPEILEDVEDDAALLEGLFGNSAAEEAQPQSWMDALDLEGGLDVMSAAPSLWDSGSEDVTADLWADPSESASASIAAPPPIEPPLQAQQESNPFSLDMLDLNDAEDSTETDTMFEDLTASEAALDLGIEEPDLSSAAVDDGLFAGLDETPSAFERDAMHGWMDDPSQSPVETNADLGDDFTDLDALLGESTVSSLDEIHDDADFTVGSGNISENQFDDLDALLEDIPPDDEGDSAASDGFDGLDALLEDASLEISEPTTSDSRLTDLNALLASSAAATAAPGVDDFADLDALLEDVPLTAPPTMEPVTAPPRTGEPEFDDLEKLLENADQNLGGSPTVRTVRGSSGSNRRAQRPGVLTDQTMRVSVKNLDNLNNLVGELVVNRNTLEQAEERLRQFLDNLLYQVQQLSDVGQRMRDLYERSLLESSLLSSRRAYQSSGNGTPQTHAIGVNFDALEMDRFTGFHTLSQEMIELIVRVRESASDIDFVVDETDQVTRNFRQITTQLQEGLTRSRMVPFAQTADRLPRGVRDNALKYGKQAELSVEGRDTLIDKMIVEQLYDPMTHLVNNAIAHGIETPVERAAAGKPPTGRITVRAFHQGNQTVISVSDDGAGIDPERVKAKAIAKGLITREEAQQMSRLETYDLLFHQGFSTVDQVDDLRGRGVGMDVVRTALNEIRGAITIDSAVGRGTTFTIRLPLTLSISKALCCISNRSRIAFPMDGVEDMLDVPCDRIQVLEDGRSCIQWRDQTLPFQHLSDLLKFNRTLGRGSVYGGNQEEDIISVVVLRSNAGSYMALQVDQVLGEQEIVIKQLEGPVPKPLGIAGATVLGDGRIMPIADVLELIDLSQGRIRRESGTPLWEKGEAQVPTAPADVKTDPTVLIVDDSITVRELLSMTFNKVGYRVEQARDGQEAWEKLRSGLPCDLVFCDIEMPRMDGLELLSRLQKDPHLNHLPIAMLTSRGADRHRQMAIQLGAKGYFTKPYLEEALLDAAQRMLKGEVLVGSAS